MKAEPQLDAYLQELTQHRISSKLKLIAAWDGLSIETQIKILSTLNHIPDEIKSKGLHSPNDYVRYLIADQFYPYNETEEDKQILKTISDDKNIIVKFTHFPSQKVHVREKSKEGHEISVLKPENFFAMSHEEQILYFSGLCIIDGEEISEIIEWGFNNQIDHKHIANLIEETVYNFNQDKLNEEDHYFDDGFRASLYSKNLEALWRLAIKLGNTDPANYLVWSLPTTGGLFDDEIFEDIIQLLPKKLAIDLLKRHDFYCLDLRKKISASKEVIYDDEIKAAAISYFKAPKISSVVKQGKREAVQSFVLIGLFLLGVICSFLDIHGWLSLACIGIPIAIWIKNDITRALNNKIDDIIKKIDKKIKKRLNSITS